MSEHPFRQPSTRDSILTAVALVRAAAVVRDATDAAVANQKALLDGMNVAELTEVALSGAALTAMILRRVRDAIDLDPSEYLDSITRDVARQMP
jgi:hypothetical protein